MKLGLRSNARGSLKHVTEANRPGSKEKMVGRDGHFNASSKKDLMETLVTLAKMVEGGDVASNTETASVNKSERREMVLAAYDDRQSGDWTELGAAIAGELQEIADREGFMRRLLIKAPLDQGQIPRIRVRTRNVTAIVSSGPSGLYPQFVYDKYLMQPEFYIMANMKVERREMEQGTGDVLEEKFLEGQQQIMVMEDRYWKQLADASTGVVNPLQVVTGGLTPDNLAVMRDQITRWNIPANNILMASDILSDLTGTAFGSWFDPVSQNEIVMTGFIGSLLGMGIMTDAYRDPLLQVFNQGDLYVLSSPEYHGAYTDRGPVQSEPVDTYLDGPPARGWNMNTLISMALHNARSLSRAQVSR